MGKVVQIKFPLNSIGLKIGSGEELKVWVAEEGGFERGQGKLLTGSVAITEIVSEEGKVRFGNIEDILKDIVNTYKKEENILKLYVDDNIQEYRIVNSCKYCEKVGETVSVSGSFE